MPPNIYAGSGRRLLTNIAKLFFEPSLCAAVRHLRDTNPQLSPVRKKVPLLFNTHVFEVL